MSDQNYIAPIQCYNDTTGEVEPARIDPATGALLIYGVSATTGTPSDISVFPRDGNHVAVSGAYNETSGEVEAVRCTNDNTLLVKIEE